jgi:NADH-quinone oxidoreductase subunit C
MSDQPVGQPAGAPELSGAQAETADTAGASAAVAYAGLPSTPRPYGGYFDDVADALARAYPGVSVAVERTVVDRGELTLHVRREQLRDVAQQLRDDEALRFELLSSLSGVHYPADAGRELHVVYQLTSMTHNRRIRLEVSAPDADPHVPSVVSVWPTADFQERETWDLFGVVFDGHPALTRIMMPDDWPGHPQRKDYPLGGIPVEYKGANVPPPEERRRYA